jgi:polysaccharide chain length determinant protein (PEP-CTERM system associated)
VIPGKRYQPNDIAKAAWRRRWFFLIPFATVLAGAVFYVNRMPDRYRSETLILVVPQRVPESYVRSTVTSRIEDRLQTISQQIMSRTRLERIVQDFDLYQDDRQQMPMQDVIERMRTRDIQVQIVKGDAFGVSYTAESPQMARAVTQRISSLFIEENLRDREVLADATSEFLENQLASARQRLIEHEEKLEAYRVQHAGELPTQVQSNMQAAQHLQLQLQGLGDALNRDRDRRSLLERELTDLTRPVARPQAAESDETPAADAAADSIVPLPAGPPARQLEAARQALRVMSARLKAEHPDMIRMTRLVKDLEARAASEPPSPTDPDALARAQRVRQLRTDVDVLTQQIATKEQQQRRLEQEVRAYQRRVEAAPTRESELVELTRDYDTLRDLYTSLLTKKEESSISANLERRQIGEQFKILDAASLPERPISPNRPRLMLFGALGGLLLGILIGALREALDSTLRTEDDVRIALSTPVVAAIPMMRSRGETRRDRLLMLAGSTAGTAIVVTAIAAATWQLLQ